METTGSQEPALLCNYVGQQQKYFSQQQKSQHFKDSLSLMGRSEAIVAKDVWINIFFSVKRMVKMYSDVCGFFKSSLEPLSFTRLL